MQEPKRVPDVAFPAGIGTHYHRKRPELQRLICKVLESFLSRNDVIMMALPALVATSTLYADLPSDHPLLTGPPLRILAPPPPPRYNRPTP